MGKLIVKNDTREEAVNAMTKALNATSVHGIETNLEYLRQIIASDVFADAGAMSTSALGDFSYHAPTIDVLTSGTQTTVQDHPGRIGYWEVGIPPSGPMDGLSFRLANRILGHPTHAAGLEITFSGATTSNS